MDFTQEDLWDAIDAAALVALGRGCIDAPPVDALLLAQVGFGYNVEFVEPDADEPRQYGDRPKRKPPPMTILLREDQSDESQHAVAARAIAKLLVPGIFAKLGIVVGTENRSAQTQLLGQVVPRLLLPTRWFAADVRRANFDLVELKERYPTAGYEAIAVRMLDVADDPMVIAIIEDGSVGFRRANRFQAVRKLTEAEERCAAKVAATEEPARVRHDGWTAWGWPTRGIPFRRIILRAVPDDV